MQSIQSRQVNKNRSQIILNLKRSSLFDTLYMYYLKYEQLIFMDIYIVKYSLS